MMENRAPLTPTLSRRERESSKTWRAKDPLSTRLRGEREG